MKVKTIGVYTFFCYGNGTIYVLDVEGVFYDVKEDINDTLYCLLIFAEHYNKEF